MASRFVGITGLLQLILVATLYIDAETIGVPPSKFIDTPWRSVVLRGGAEYNDGSTHGDDQPLSEAAIMDKLNEVPTFVLMTASEADGQHGFATIQADDGSMRVEFFIEASDAQAMLSQVQAAEPLQSWRLGKIGLGHALQLCNGFDGYHDESFATHEGQAIERTRSAFAEQSVSLTLRGHHALVEEYGSMLAEMLRATGFATGGWTLPVFVCDDDDEDKLREAERVPIFLNPQEYRMSKDGEDSEIDPEACTIMDIRMVVAGMHGKEGMPWRKFHFHGPVDGYALANELQPV